MRTYLLRNALLAAGGALSIAAIVLAKQESPTAAATEPVSGDAKLPSPPFIKTVEVTLTAGTAPNADSGAALWMIFSVKPGGGQTDSSVQLLGHGLAKGETKTFTTSTGRGDFNEQRCGGITLVNGMNGGSPDLQIESVRIIGIDAKGQRWAIAKYTPLATQPFRKWLANDPAVSNQGPALPIPTIVEWQRE